MDSGFYATMVLVELLNKGVFGAALVKKRRYWPVNIKGDAIYDYFDLNEVGNVDVVKQVEDGVSYRVFFMKEPDCLMKLMTKY